MLNVLHEGQENVGRSFGAKTVPKSLYCLAVPTVLLIFILRERQRIFLYTF